MAGYIGKTQSVTLAAEADTLDSVTARGATTDSALSLTNGLVVDKDGATVATFDRATSDGAIAEFQKDGTTVGSIGSRAGVVSSIVLDTRTGGHGLTANSGGILPADEDGDTKDDDTNLGESTTRFKDLYLSGGVYLGGTGAANYLDDYEEGTWTASFYTSTGGGGTLLGTKTATYTKIGRLVHVSYYADNVGSGIESIAGLPFSMTGYASGITADGVNFYTSTGMTVNYRTADNSYTRTEFVYQTTS